MGFMLPSSATAGGLQSLHGHRAPDDWLVGFNVGATNRTGQAVAVFRARRRAGRPVKKRGGGAPRRVPSQTAPLAARRPTLDQETLLILVVLAFLLRCRADRELIWALLYILLF